MASDYEDWRVHGKSTPYIGGRPVVAEQTELSMRLEPEERLAWSVVYGTLVDCYKIATGQWRHFKPMRWHHDNDYERTLATARERTLEWIESEMFADYVALLGFTGTCASEAARRLLEGKCNLKAIRTLINEISTGRNTR